MNWTEGNLSRYTRDRGPSQDRFRQRQAFASAHRAQVLGRGGHERSEGGGEGEVEEEAGRKRSSNTAFTLSMSRGGSHSPVGQTSSFFRVNESSPWGHTTRKPSVGGTVNLTTPSQFCPPSLSNSSSLPSSSPLSKYAGAGQRFSRGESQRGSGDVGAMRAKRKGGLAPEPTGRSVRQKGGGEGGGGEPREKDKGDEDEELEAMARRLLAIPDWAGLGLQEEIEGGQTFSAYFDRRRDSPVEGPRTAGEAAVASHFRPLMTSPSSQQATNAPHSTLGGVRRPLSPAPLHLHHPRPLRRGGHQVVENLETTSTGASQGQGSVAMEEGSDNLLPLYKDLPENPVNLDFLDDCLGVPRPPSSASEGDRTEGGVYGGSSSDNETNGPLSRSIIPSSIHHDSLGERANLATSIKRPRGSNRWNRSPRSPIRDDGDVSLTALLSDDESSSSSNKLPRLSKYVKETCSAPDGSQNRPTEQPHNHQDDGVQRGRKHTDDLRGRKPVESRDQAKEKKEKSAPRQADDDWLNFLFSGGTGDGDGSGSTHGGGHDVVGCLAFDIAKRDAARELVPSVSSCAGRGYRPFEALGGSDAGATCGTELPVDAAPDR